MVYWEVGGAVSWVCDGDDSFYYSGDEGYRFEYHFLPEYSSVGAPGDFWCIVDIYIDCNLLFGKHVNASDGGV